MADPYSPGLYVHIPFCRTKCLYCDFYSVTGEPDSDRFLRAAAAEASMRREEMRGPAGTLYVGGGTPSVLDAAAAARIPGLAEDVFGLEEGAETTIEVNPDDVTPETMEIYLEGGFDRVSIGVQSFDDAELAFLGRRHDSRRASEAIGAARSAGFDRIGIDLIFGLAGQTLEGWRATLGRALAHRPDHISCYQLTVESGTPLGARREAGEKVCSSEAVQRDLYVEASRVLTGAGFIHYEVSNFASGEDSLSSHNIRYWLRGEYVGIGPSAHSFDGRTRRWNRRSVAGWLEAVEAGELPFEGEETLSEAQVRLERLMLGFRTVRGVEISLLREHPDWENTLGDLLARSLVRLEGERAVPTLEGFLVADRLPVLFM